MAGIAQSKAKPSIEGSQFQSIPRHNFRNYPMRPTATRIIRIGNRLGIRVPKALLREAHLSGRVELQAEPGRIIVQRQSTRPQAGWAEAARMMRERDDDRLADW